MSILKCGVYPARVAFENAPYSATSELLNVCLYPNALLSPISLSTAKLCRII